MRPVSKRFLQALRGSHTAVFRARLCTTFQTGTNPAGTELPIAGGDVIVSATSDVHASLRLTTQADWPRTGNLSLAPYGSEVYVERGIEFGNGQREFVGLGYFRIDTLEQDVTPDGLISMALPDRDQGIIDGRFIRPRQFSAGSVRGNLVTTLITEVYPGAVIEWDDVALRDGVIGRAIITENDRAAVLRDFVKSLGKVGYFDHRGVYVIKTPPSVAGAAAWSVDAGRDGVLVQMSRALTREGVYNAVVASGEAADATPPVTAGAYNLDPASPTYYLGPFGPVPMFYSSPFLTTYAQARSAAYAQLRQQLGIPYQVELAAIPNPALEAWDVIDVIYPKVTRVQSYWRERHVVDQVTIPLDTTTPVQVRTRQQQTELIGDSA